MSSSLTQRPVHANSARFTRSRAYVRASILAGSWVAIVGVACGGPPPSAPSELLGQHVEFSLPSDGGDLVSIPISNASSTVLDFWSPTCIPCRKSLPALYERKADIEAKGGRLILVAVLSDSESTEQARSALASWGVKAHFLVDRGNVSQSQAGVRALPTTLVLDRSGALRWVAPVGASDGDVVAAVR